MTQDTRGFFKLPQSHEEAAYYTYGTPLHGEGQYCHPKMLNFIFALDFNWGAVDKRKIGIGNVSLANGAAWPNDDHKSHKDGLQVDIRPLRKDGKNLPVTVKDSQHDAEGTRKLVEMIIGTGLVKVIYFNDSSIYGVNYRDKHDNHLHIGLK